MAPAVPTCVWRASPPLVVALDERLGAPVDAYVNGSQVWLAEAAALGQLTLEWRLHPVAGYRRPPGVSAYEVFEATAEALALGRDAPAPLERLWDGLEAFPAYGGEVEPAVLATACGDELGVVPDAYGLVDHQPIGDEWERTGGRTSIIAALLDQLGAGS